MWWILAFIVVMMIFSRLDSIIELAKSNNPNYQKQVELDILKKEKEQSEIVKQLHELKNVDCFIESDNLIYTSIQNNTIKGKVIDIDNEWVELESIIKKKNKKFYLKTSEISSVSKIV